LASYTGADRALPEAVPYDGGVAFVRHFEQGTEAFVKAWMFCR
jgi:hypothetical protein